MGFNSVFKVLTHLYNIYTCKNGKRVPFKAIKAKGRVKGMCPLIYLGIRCG